MYFYHASLTLTLQQHPNCIISDTVVGGRGEGEIAPNYEVLERGAPLQWLLDATKFLRYWHV